MEGRLPKSVVPASYDLELWTDLETCEFKGKLAIGIDIVKPTESIKLHSADLEIQSVSLSYGDRTIPGTIGAQKDEMLVIEFESARELIPGKAILNFEYSGILNEKLDGYYKSSYERDGVKKNMAVTVFEPSDARRFLPCWDEPAFKATFKFKVHAPADRTVLSNMPVKNEISDENTKTVEFEESVLMSTYLLLVAIGEFEYIEATTEDGILLRVYTRHGLLEKGRFALELMQKLLPFYAEYFQLRYPLPKLDIVAVPVFKAGALENFGCVVFLEQALFVDDSTSAHQKEETAISVAHELAHMWFGNIVTMEWWSHLWLNEGMATWISYMAVDHLIPEWNIWMEFGKAIDSGFNLDSLEKSHPVETSIGAHETNDAFDAISYFKGASIVHMLQKFLGRDGMQKGLAAYTAKYAFKNAESQDLWYCLEKATGHPVRALMTSWTKQVGYPVVRATLLDDQTLLLEQARFFASGKQGSGQWMIPICITSDVEETSVLLTDMSMTVRLSGKSSWIKLNAGQTGFYRVQYDDALEQKVRNAILSQQLSAADTLGILDDIFSLCKAGNQSLNSLLSLLEAYKGEIQPAVLSKLVEVAGQIAQVVKVAVPELSPKVSAYLCKVLEPAAMKLGWERSPGESPQVSSVRGAVLRVMVSFDHQESLLEAKRRFNSRPVPADIRTAVYRSAMKESSSLKMENYEALLDLYRGSNDAEERSAILGAIAGSLDESIIIKALEFGLTDEVLAQDVSEIFSGLRSSQGIVAWQWIKDHWEELLAKLGYGFMWNRVLSAVTLRLWTTEAADDVKSYLADRLKSQKRVDECCEKIRLRVQWSSKVKDEDIRLPFI